MKPEATEHFMPVIKPCPFCWNDASVHAEQILKPDWCCWVECNNDECLVCPDTDMFASEQEAIEAWNKRVDR